MSVLQLGRLRLEADKVQAVRNPGQITTGQETSRSFQGVLTTADPMLGLRLAGELQSVVSTVVPAIWVPDGSVAGWWRVTDVGVQTPLVTEDHWTVRWVIDLDRVGNEREVEFESRRAGAVVPNDHGLAGERWHAPPASAYGYSTGATAPSKVVRQSDGGLNIDVYRGLPGDVDPLWGITPDGFYDGAPRLLVDGLPVAGTHVVIDLAGGWLLENALIRVKESSDPTSTLDVEHWSGGAWHTKTYDVQQDGNTITDLLAVTVKRNDPSEVVVRLLADPAGGAIGRTVLDLSLRRGARHLSCLLQRHAAATLKVQRHTAEAGTDIAGGVRATNDDADGDRYILASSKTVTKGLTQGSISKTAVTLFDFAIGVEVDGSTAQAGDTAADVVNQYLDGTDTVDVPVVR